MLLLYDNMGCPSPLGSSRTWPWKLWISGPIFNQKKWARNGALQLRTSNTL